MQIEVRGRTVDLTEDDLGIITGRLPMTNGKTIEITSQPNGNYIVSYQNPGGGIGSTYLLESDFENLEYTLEVFVRELSMMLKIDLQ